MDGSIEETFAYSIWILDDMKSVFDEVWDEHRFRMEDTLSDLGGLGRGRLAGVAYLEMSHFDDMIVFVQGYRELRQEFTALNTQRAMICAAILQEISPARPVFRSDL